jgi:hypothetical protein
MVSVSIEVQAPTVTLYVIRWLPAPAVAGSKVPFTASVIPFPLHVPPPVAATKFTGTSVIQIGQAGEMVA